MASEWYYMKGDEKIGPVSAADLKSLTDSGSLSPDNKVWKEGMAEWNSAENIKGLLAPAESAVSEGKKPPPIPTARPGAKSPNFPPGDAAFVFAFLNKMGNTSLTPFITIIVNTLAAIGKWICMAVGILFITTAIKAENTLHTAALSGVACFFGICARICQAEQHSRSGRGQ